jgi:peptidoglycan/LPS O-acetylase OafA/YrhL
MQYRREIDGLRAIAVVPVILFHAGFPWFSGGFIGVDVFFVVSGYLITSILLNDLEKNKFSIIHFYERRARRILPALFFIILCSLPFAFHWMSPQQFELFTQTLVAMTFFASNVLFWMKADYFAPEAEENPLLHTWSLAVEEQFYLFFPIFLLFLWRTRRASVLYVVILLSAMSFLFSEWGSRHYPSANFYLVFSRIWELGAGALCAILLHKKQGTLGLGNKSGILGLLGLFLILISVFIYDDKTPFPSVYTLLPVLGSVLIILFSYDHLIYKILSTRILVGIGLISFSAYLWHQPLMAFAQIRSASEPSAFLMGLLAIASLCLAYFSWKFVEQPFRNRNGLIYFSRKSIFSYSAVGSTLIFSIGLYGHSTDGMPNRLAPSGIAFSKIQEMTQTNTGLNKKCSVNGSNISGLLASGTCQTGKSPNILVWGDSFAMHLVPGLVTDKSIDDTSLIQLTKSSCAPIFDLALTTRFYPRTWARECIEFNEAVKTYLINTESIEYVIMSSPMSIIKTETLNNKGQINSSSYEIVKTALNETANFLRIIGKKPIFVAPPPQNGHNLAKCPTYNLTFNSIKSFECSFYTNDISEFQRKVTKFLSSDDLALDFVDLEPFICDETKCFSYINDINIYRDSGHLSIIGSKYIGEKFDLLKVILEKANQSARANIEKN